MELKSIRKVDFGDKRVLLRVDYNVPISNGQVTDTTRIRATLPTIAHLLDDGASLIICSHLGRPRGQVEESLRLTPVAPILEEMLNQFIKPAGFAPRRIVKLDDCVGQPAHSAVEAAGPNDIVLLENLRFHSGETTNDPGFAKQLATLADSYVNDAFGTLHRAHASTEGVAHLLPAQAGLLVEQEVQGLIQVTENPAKPLVIVIGGKKISGKIDVLESLIPRADTVLIGGAMANTFLLAQGHKVGRSVVEEEMADTAKRMLDLAKQHNTEFLLPVDYVVTDDLLNPTGISTVCADSIGGDDIAVDIGRRTCDLFHREITRARTVFWNGPMGVFEQEQFSLGTLSVAKALADVFKTAHTVVGGGESVAAVNSAGLARQIHHVSTGGGASLEFIAGKELPGLKMLMV